MTRPLGTEETAGKAMTLLTGSASIKALKEAEMYIQVPVCKPGGIRSADLVGFRHTLSNLILIFLPIRSKNCMRWSAGS